MDDGWDIEDGLFLEECALAEGGDCALVIIDIQEKLLAVMRDKEALVANALKLVRFANLLGLPVLVTEQEKLGPTVPELAEEIREFRPVMKLDFNANDVPEFVKRLDDLDRATVVVAGIESHICVTQTVLSLLPVYDVHVIADAVSSRTEENKSIALDRMRFNGATISSTEMFMYEALKRAGTDEFRAVLEMIK